MRTNVVLPVWVLPPEVRPAAGLYSQPIRTVLLNTELATNVLLGFAAQSDVFWRQSQRGNDRRTCHVRQGTEGHRRNFEYHLLRFRSRHSAAIDDWYKVGAVAPNIGIEYSLMFFKSFSHYPF